MMPRIAVDAADPDPGAIARAAEILRAGGLMVVPTETVYGLAAAADNPAAVDRVRRLKRRSADHLLPVQVADQHALERLCVAGSGARRVVAGLCPGPVTVVLRRRDGGGTLGVRIPRHAVALALLRAVDRPLVVTSANRSGDPPPTTAAEAVAAMGAGIDGVIDAGPTGGDMASTVVDLAGDRPRILREGPVTAREIETLFDSGADGAG